ncbi:Hypothetical predicted protein [Podarcis lilfordi]|uniref:Uncharacterized protein n=1 Tax=Podarcis lilfordi TaxID=74358 RepID=A0AA35LNT7_9SAUR|nr:Hypothetical predicted protein [Podarcis lilfordi]
MANRGNSQAPHAVQGGPQTPTMPCIPQAIAQLFSAIKTFYLQCRPAASSASTPVAASQDCILDTLPSEQAHSGPSTSASSTAQSGSGSGNRPHTPSQSSHAQKSKSGAAKPSVSGASSKSTRPGRSTTNQQVINMPSIFQESPSQPIPSEGASGSSSEEEVPPQQSTPASTDPAPEVSGIQGGKRKAKKKHISKKSNRSEPSDSEDETGTSSSDYDSDATMESYWGEGEDLAGVPLWVHERRANSHGKTFNGTLEWKGGALVEDVKTSTNVSTNFILGNHLSK